MLAAAEVARLLGAPLDIVVVRKCVGPDDVALGAVAEHEIRVENAAMVEASGITRAQLRALVADRLRDLAQADAVYRRVRPPLPMAGPSSWSTAG